MTGENFKLVKLFSNRDVPLEAQFYLRQAFHYTQFEVIPYHISYYVNEAQDDPPSYPEKEVAAYKTLDEWLLSNGAEPNETIYIKDGKI